jgi:hypothetical protein
MIIFLEIFSIVIFYIACSLIFILIRTENKYSKFSKDEIKTWESYGVFIAVHWNKNEIAMGRTREECLKNLFFLIGSKEYYPVKQKLTIVK